MKPHEHNYIPSQIDDECSVCGLLKSTIESMGRKKCGCDGNDLDQFGKCPHDVRTSDQVWDEALTPMIEEVNAYKGGGCLSEIQDKINELVKAVNKLQRP